MLNTRKDQRRQDNNNKHNANQAGPSTWVRANRPLQPTTATTPPANTTTATTTSTGTGTWTAAVKPTGTPRQPVEIANKRKNLITAAPPSQAIQSAQTGQQGGPTTSPDAVRYQRNKDANRVALERIYAQFYDSAGDRKPLGPDPWKTLYNSMGAGDSSYLTTSITNQEFDNFSNNPKASRVVSQGVAEYEQYLSDLNDYHEIIGPLMDAITEYLNRGEEVPLDLVTDFGDLQKTQPKEPTGPKTTDEALAEGDYFHVLNKYVDKTKSMAGRMRRIIVNVRDQRAALDVSRSLDALLQDSVVGPNLEEYKVFLSTNATGTQPLKYDKIVVYYGFDQADPTGPDIVGDRIVAAIRGAIPKNDFDDVFAPFYSSIVDGIAWAEEPGYYVTQLQDSFTATRTSITKEVIDRYAIMPNKEFFIDLVNEEFEKKSVDVDHPHRHITASPQNRRLSPRPGNVGTSV